MKIPPIGSEELERFVMDVRDNCFASQRDRQSEYDVLRRYYLYGTNQYVIVPVAYNKIGEAVDKKTSFLFSAETTAFSVEMKAQEPENRDLQMTLAEKGAEAVKDAWTDSGIDIITDMCIRWSFVYNTTFMKIQRDRGTIAAYFVDPGTIGVLDESSPHLHTQEAIAMRYWESWSKVERILKSTGKEEQLSKLTKTDVLMEHRGFPGAGKNLLIAQGQALLPDGPITGFANAMQITNALERPYIQEDQVLMYEIWIREDDAGGEFKDYRVFTMADPDVILFDDYAKKRFVEKEHPFIKFTPVPVPNYFWGWSDIKCVLELQDRVTKRLDEIFTAMSRNLDPPVALFSTMSGRMDEKTWSKLAAPGGRQNFPDSSGKIQEMPNNLPPDIWEEMQALFGLFDDLLGMTDIMKGKGTTGVRSKGQTEMLSSFGSSKLKKQAMLLEDSQERLATIILKLLCKYDDTHYLLDLEGGKTQKATLGQLTQGFMVKVDAHSSSPLYMNEMTDLAFQLRQLDPPAITNKELLELIRLPMKDKFKYELEKREEAQAKEHEEEKQLEKIKVLKGHQR